MQQVKDEKAALEAQHSVSEDEQPLALPPLPFHPSLQYGNADSPQADTLRAELRR